MESGSIRDCMNKKRRKGGIRNSPRKVRIRGKKLTNDFARGELSLGGVYCGGSG